MNDREKLIEKIMELLPKAPFRLLEFVYSILK